MPRPLTSPEREHGRARTEGQQRHDAAVEGVGRVSRGSAAPRPGERRRDQQCRQQEGELSERKRGRVQDVIEQAARGRGARARIGKGQEIVLHQPEEMRRHHGERDQERDPRAGRRQRLAGIAVEQQKQRQRHRQHDHEIFRPQRHPQRQSEQQPVGDAAALEPGMKGPSGERPERQLDHVVIELGGGVVEVMQPVDDQDRHQRAARADERQRGPPHDGKGRDDRDLRHDIVGGVDSDQPVDDLDQPPRQRRQLVVAQLPFAAVGQRLDQIERQIRIEDRRQRGPDHEMQNEEQRKGRLRAAVDHGDQSGHLDPQAL